GPQFRATDSAQTPRKLGPLGLTTASREREISGDDLGVDLGVLSWGAGRHRAAVGCPTYSRPLDQAGGQRCGAAIRTRGYGSWHEPDCDRAWPRPRPLPNLGRLPDRAERADGRAPHVRGSVR